MWFVLFDGAHLERIMLTAPPKTIKTYLEPLNQQMEAASINTYLRVCHFLSQIGHESNDLRWMEEVGTGQKYEGSHDLGNVQAGDGRRFKGRGPIQITGRGNYLAYGQARGKGDYYTIEPNNLLLASDPAIAIDSACWYWVSHGLNALADSDDAQKVTKRINGGLNGFTDRFARLERAKTVLRDTIT